MGMWFCFEYHIIRKNKKTHVSVNPWNSGKVVAPVAAQGVINDIQSKPSSLVARHPMVRCGNKLLDESAQQHHAGRHLWRLNPTDRV